MWYRTALSLNIPDLYAKDRNLLYDAEARSLLVVPLTAHDDVLGALAIDSIAYGAFTADHERILAIAASQVAASIDNARLYSEAQERARHLADANRDLKALDHIRNELVQNLSHELRTPLAFVKGYSHLMRDGDLGPVTEEQVAALNVIDQKSETISRFIADLLTLETLDTKGLRLQQLDLNALAEQSVTGAQLAHRESSHLRFQFVGTGSPLPIIGDADRLNQVLDNLIGNAVKFSPEQSCIKVRTWVTSDDCFNVSVSDSGIGIPVDKLPHIFERFYQVDTSLGKEYGGAGLGLAIVQRIVESHNGSVYVESELGKGSTFTVLLPRAGSSSALSIPAN